MTTKTHFLTELPLEIKKKIERWYRLSILLFSLCFSAMLFVTAAQIIDLSKDRKKYKALKADAPEEIVDQEKNSTKEYSIKNKLSTKLITLCAQLLPDDLHLLSYTLTANQIILSGSGNSADRVSDYLAALQKKVPEVRNRLTSLKKAFCSLTFELTIELPNIQN